LFVFNKYSGDQIEKNEMSESYSTYGGLENCMQVFGWGAPRERDHLKDLGVDGRAILKWIFRK
jgi:hypothetical protein